jgi:chitinase
MPTSRQLLSNESTVDPASVAAQSTFGDMKVFAVYTTDWAQYRSTSDAKYQRPDWCKPYGLTPKHLAQGKFTHIFYAFAKVEKDTFEVVGTEWNDDALIKELMGAKGKAKTLISIGGWSFSRAWGVFEGTGSDLIFPKLASTKAGRTKFINSAIKYAKDRGFDGIDLDWEYPNWDGKAPQERSDFTQLLKEMRVATKNQGLLLTAAFRAAVPKRHYDLREVQKHLDFINLMTYDYYGGSFGDGDFLAKVHTPILDCNGRWCKKPFDIQTAIRQYRKNGVPANKIVMGFANYGRTFKLKNPGQPLSANKHGVALAKGTSPPGECTLEPGALSWYEIKRLAGKAGSSGMKHDLEETMSAWMTFGKSSEYWVGFDTTRTHRHKMCYARSKNLLGVFAWDAELDDDMELLTALRANYDTVNCAGYERPSCPAKPANVKCIDADTGSSDGTQGAGCPYTIKAGDTFWELAQERPGVTVAQIQALNPGVDPTKLSVGQTIKLPC